MSDEADHDPERRSSERRRAFFPAEIESETGETSVAMILDASVTGANFLTSERLTVGQKAKLVLYLSADTSKGRAIEGKVVRVEPTPKDREWPFQVGIQFDAPMVEMEDDIKKLSELQTKLFRLRR